MIHQEFIFKLNFFSFYSTIIAGIQYSTEEKFYEKINSHDAKTYQSVQGVNIVAKKCTPFKWPRFTMEKKRVFLFLSVSKTRCFSSVQFSLKNMC